MSIQEQVVSSTPDTYEEEFQVERILDKKVEYGETFYLIKWQGYEGQDTWEPEKHLIDCPDLIKDFEERTRAAMVQENEKVDTVGETSTISSQGESDSDFDPPSTDVTVGFERGLEPQKILGATHCNGKLCFFIKWKGSDVADIVSREEANAKCPQIVIKFYEDRILWNTNRTISEMFRENANEESVALKLTDNTTSS